MSDPPSPAEPDKAHPPPPNAPQPGIIQLSPQLLAQLAAASQQGLFPYASPPPGFGSGPIMLGSPQPLAQQTIQIWQGQFPPPEAIERYERVQAGCFDRILGMAERLQMAQLEQTKRAHDYTQTDMRRGQWLGFSATVLSMISACACSVVGAEWGAPGAFWVAGALVSVPVMAVAKALVDSSRGSFRLGIPSIGAPSSPAVNAPTNSQAPDMPSSGSP
jgi:uncharacterized membrane protein